MPNLIEATIINGKYAGENVCIPRIPMIPTDLPFDFKRLQFPVRLAFAMTINKSQGQSLSISNVISCIQENSIENKNEKCDNENSESTEKTSTQNCTETIQTNSPSLTKPIIAYAPKVENTFEVFCISVAVQLNQLPKRQVLASQLKIQTILTEELLKYEESRKSNNKQTQIYHDTYTSQSRLSNYEEGQYHFLSNSSSTIDLNIPSGVLQPSKALKRQVRSIRNNEIAAPCDPSDLFSLQIPDEYQKYSPSIGVNENFFLADSGLSNERILVFDRPLGLKLLKDSKIWYMDGIFKEECILLPNKKEQTYVKLFSVINQLQPDFQATSVSCDFELGAITAIKSSFENINIFGCCFHLSQFFLKKVEELHLLSKYNNKANFCVAIKTIIALAFIPLYDLDFAANELADELPDELIPLFEWFEEFYIVNNEDTIAVNNSLCQPIEFTRDDDTSEYWDSKQAKYFCEKYPWLYFKTKMLGCNICQKVNLNLNKNQVSHVHTSSNWIQCDIVPSGNSISKQQASLRKKIFKHKCS
ncbi:hypothetical protein QTP88_019327 [Uroleucon formosanum]